MEHKRLVVGISGASGAPLAISLLKALQSTEIETHLVVTPGGERTLKQEAGLSLTETRALADACYDNTDIGAPPASGSWKSMGMVVVPCSMKTLAGVHSGYSDGLLLRAADVALKERRRLVLAARECPLSAVHLRNLYELSQMGAVIVPPVLSFYQGPNTLQDAVDHIVGKLLDQFGVEYAGFRRWNGMKEN